MQELTSSTKPGDGFHVPLCVTLRKSARWGEWVTHRMNAETKDRFWGNYFTALADKGGEQGAYVRAFRDYVRRCKALDVEPAPQATFARKPSASALLAWIEQSQPRERTTP